MRRRQFLAAVGVSGTLAAIGSTTGSDDGVRWGWTSNDVSQVRSGPTIDLEPVVDGNTLTQPVSMRTPTGDPEQRYIADKLGQIYRQDGDGGPLEPFLDIADQLVEPESWEQGLIGLAFHPKFTRNRRFFVRYSAPTRTGTPDEYSHTFVLSEFQASADLRTAIPSSERSLLELPQPGPTHQSGAIEFGPDGYLYVASGSGGSGYVDDGFRDSGPGHADDWYLLNNGGNGQDLSANLLGSILRLDVDTDADDPYGIPDDNPLVGREGLDEQYAWGFRNPWGMSFDGEDLYVGDVGQRRFEEVNTVERGGNYGWNVREGRSCLSNSLLFAFFGTLPFLSDTYPMCPTTTPDGESLNDPAILYSHESDGRGRSRAVVGGYVYRNHAIPALRGKYVFADFVLGSEGLFAAKPDGDAGRPWPMERLQVASSDDETRRPVLSFARDAVGRLYVLTSSFAEGSGRVERLVPAE